MTVVAWRDIRVRVRIAAPSLDELESAFKEIENDVGRIAKKRVLTARHNLEAHDVYSTKQEKLSDNLYPEADLG